MKIVEFYRTHDRYIIIDEDAQFKNTSTDEWEPAVVYRQYELLGKDGKYTEVPENLRLTFVRTKENFWEKFNII